MTPMTPMLLVSVSLLERVGRDTPSRRGSLVLPHGSSGSVRKGAELGQL